MWFPLLCPLGHWSVLPCHLNCYFFLLVKFSIKLFYFKICELFFGTFSYFPSLFWSCYCVHCFFLWVQWASLGPFVWTLYQVRYYVHFFNSFFYFFILKIIHSFIILVDSQYLCVCIMWNNLFLPFWNEWVCVGVETYDLILPKFFLFVSMIVSD